MSFLPRGKRQGTDAKPHRVPRVQGGEFLQYQLGEIGLASRNWYLPKRGIGGVTALEKSDLIYLY